MKMGSRRSFWYRFAALFLALALILPATAGCVVAVPQATATPQAPAGPQGSTGSQGPAGPQGAVGPQGPAGPSGQFSVPSIGGITSLLIRSRQVVYDGRSFGSVGQYELLIGKAYGTLNPKDPLNACIVNLDRAPRNQSGLVEYSMDVQILKPVDMSKGSKKLLYDVVNRGIRVAMAFSGQTGHADATGWTQAGAGDGFFQRQGYVVAWSGWEGTLPSPATATTTSLLGTSFPVSRNGDGSPITGMSREEFLGSAFDAATGQYTASLTYPAASTDKSKATLTVRQQETDPRQPVPAANWDYVNDRQIKVTKVAGFDKGALYEFIYEAKDPIVTGIGLAATRDLVSFLRFSGRNDNPLAVGGAPGVQYAMAYGLSQSASYLKEFLYWGFNQDTSGRKVFDGMLLQNSGARHVKCNYAFAQPSRFSRQHETHLDPGSDFPFAYKTTYDALSGRTDGILAIAEKTGTSPKIYHVDSEAEFWQGQASLMVTDTAGKAITNPDSVRLFFLAGRPHSPGVDGGVLLVNPASGRPIIKALLVSLDNWVTGTGQPLPSRYPSLADGSLVSVATAGTQWPVGIPRWPWVDKINNLEVRDYSVEPPAIKSIAYPLFVPRLNTDGNTMDGIVYPDISVPVGTYSGRSPRPADAAPGNMNALAGAYRQFELTKAARDASGDPRLSLAERYPGGNAEYQAKLKAAADALVAAGYMLQEDATTYYTMTLPTAAPKP